MMPVLTHKRQTQTTFYRSTKSCLHLGPGLSRTDGSGLKVGDRIVSEESYGTIRYLGEVPPTKGIWLGVEWDNPERGKHDGTHNGKKYFQTSHPHSGSFVRANKVDGGITIIQAVHERYGLKKDDEAGVRTDELFVLDQFFNQTVVEMVGAKKVNKMQSEFEKLRKISVYEMKVYHAGPEKQFGTLCPIVTDLDIAKTLLTSWEQIAEVTCQLPYLKELNVSENVLLIPKDPGSLSGSFAKLKSVTMNKMGLDWKQVLTICSMFPALEALHVCFNNIDHLTDAIHVLKGLKTLDLITNDIHSWEEVLKLGNLPFLENLLMSENKIKSVHFPGGFKEKTHAFSQLKVLIIKDNLISEWSSVNELNKLQCLEELQVGNNPLMKTYNLETVRQLLIAKVATVKLISRTPVTYEERKGAEIDYLKRFGIEWKSAGGNSDSAKNKPSVEFLTNHPRFGQMVEKWGAPEDSELGEKSTALKDNLLAIKIISSKHPNKGTINKKLPGTMSIQKLKTLIQRLYKMSSEPRLTYTSHKVKTEQEIELDNDMRQLSFFSIESGDTIKVAW